MRCLWIASGLAFALLTLSVALRPAALPIAPPVESDPLPPRTLSDEDLSQILALRAELGSPADRFGGSESQAAFEQQLRQIASLPTQAASDSAKPSGNSTNADNPRQGLIDNDRAAQAQ